MYDDVVIQDVRGLSHAWQLSSICPNMLKAPAQCLTSAICSVGRYKRQMAEICVKAVIAVADLQRKDVNLELIKVCAAKLWLFDCRLACLTNPTIVNMATK